MMRGEMNGFHNALIDEDCFLFTSESVGEGHPGTPGVRPGPRGRAKEARALHAPDTQ